MFSDKKKQPDFSNEQNKIAQGTVLTGDISSDGNFRVEGEVNGNLHIKGKIVIGETGRVNGEILSENADIEGGFEGKLKVNTCLNLKSTAVINGEVITDQLVVEAGATFNATCQMSGAVKTLEDGTQSKAKQESKTA